jgi:hypothetical protein
MFENVCIYKIGCFGIGCDKFTVLFFLFCNASKNGLDFENELSFKMGLILKMDQNLKIG